jgi:2-oxoisovalerate dehydrogenase E1 component alpha subunit
LTCSVGHHSTSDDSFAYRPRQEVEDRKRIDNPIARFRLFLESRGWWSAEEEEESYKVEVKKEVMKAFKRGETLPRNELNEMFSDVYGGEEPWTIVSPVSNVDLFQFSSLQTEQREELKILLKKYGKSWEPWRSELKKYKGEGKDLLDS